MDAKTTYAFRQTFPHPRLFMVRTSGLEEFKRCLQAAVVKLADEVLAKVLTLRNFYKKLFYLRLVLGSEQGSATITVFAILGQLFEEDVNQKEIVRVAQTSRFAGWLDDSAAYDTFKQVEHVGWSIPNYRNYLGVAEALVNGFEAFSRKNNSNLDGWLHQVYRELDKSVSREQTVAIDNATFVPRLLSRSNERAVNELITNWNRPVIFSRVGITCNTALPVEVTPETFRQWGASNSHWFRQLHPGSWNFIHGLIGSGVQALTTSIPGPEAFEVTADSAFSIASACAVVNDPPQRQNMTAWVSFATVHCLAVPGRQFFGEVEQPESDLILPVTHAVERAMMDRSLQQRKLEFLRCLAEPQRFHFTGYAPELPASAQLPIRQAILDFLKKNLE